MHYIYAVEFTTMRSNAPLLLLFTLLISSCQSGIGNKMSDTTIDSTKRAILTSQAGAQGNDKGDSLYVRVLPTVYGIDDSADYGYPKYVQAINAGTLIADISAYAAGSKVWLAPKGWTGKGACGADGNIVATLYTQKDSSESAARISYCEFPACAICIEEAASQYFPEAMKDYDINFNADHKNNIALNKELKIQRISSRLVTYTLPGHNDLLVKGVAYYIPQSEGDEYFAEAKFAIPKEQGPLMDLLVRNFIERIKSNNDPDSLHQGL